MNDVYCIRLFLHVRFHLGVKRTKRILTIISLNYQSEFQFCFQIESKGNSLTVVCWTNDLVKTLPLAKVSAALMFLLDFCVLDQRKSKKHLCLLKICW